MEYAYSDLITKIDGWAALALKQGWIDKQLLLSLVNTDDEDANTLFSQQHSRPLVVAFMGGTGVGKSSLLNKLADQSIARTGVERPTSREVTLYYHQSVSIHHLEENFPLQQIQVSSHTKAVNEKVVWIDMPDFDSTEKKNKGIVMQWLPYVDVLIYVVSPERYRDNKAWQLLLAEGVRHAWLFVMNQWDKGVMAQYDDFKLQLSKAGFDYPLIYKTVCTEQFDDEFSRLQTTIESLAADKTVEQLEIRSTQQRNKNTGQKLQHCLTSLGNRQAFDELIEKHTVSWSQTEEILNQGFEWPIKQAAQVYSKKGVTNKQQENKLWDDWAKSRFNDYLDDLILTADQSGLPSTSFRNALSAIRNKAEKIIQTQVVLGCRQSMINPGNVIQRNVLKIAGACEFVLPLVAMVVVGFEVYQEYYDGLFTDEAFLGVNFVVHSLLLILISWLFPFFVSKKMQPSLEKAAINGQYKGLEVAMTTIAMEVKDVINVMQGQHQEIVASLEKLIVACNEGDKNTIVEPKSENLERMLIDSA